MSKRLRDLFSDLLGVMENQKRALGESRIGDAVVFQDERQQLIEHIRVETGRTEKGGEDTEITRTLNQILALDIELQASVKSEMKDILDKLGTIRDVKNTLALQGGRRPTGGRINVNA